MTKTKKIILMSSLVVILAVTTVLNFALSDRPVAPTVGSATSDYFESYRTERMTRRNQELLQLDSIIASVSTDSQEYKNAVNMKLQLIDIMERELVLESLLKSKNFTTDAVININQNSDNVNVFVKADVLQLNDFLQIYNILKDEGGVPAANINIMAIRS